MPNAMLPRERCDYSAIVDRPPLKLPGDARLVFWTIVNLEVWEIERPMARQVLPAPTGPTHIPDVPNWSWHEYGMRVGVWRFFESFDAPAHSPDARDQRRASARIIRVSPNKRVPTAGNSWAIPTCRVRSMPSRTKRR